MTVYFAVKHFALGDHVARVSLLQDLEREITRPKFLLKASQSIPQHNGGAEERGLGGRGGVDGSLKL